MATLTTLTSSNPAFFSLLRSTEAPWRWIPCRRHRRTRSCGSARPVGPGLGLLGLQLVQHPGDRASPFSPPSGRSRRPGRPPRRRRLARRITEPTRNDVAAANRTDKVTPTRLLPGVWAYTAMIGRRRRGPQPGPEDHQGEDAHHAAGDGGQNGDGLQQHEREVDLVDAAEELDDQRRRGGVAGHPGAEDGVGEQQPGARPWLASSRNRIDLPFSAACWMPGSAPHG